MNNTPTPIHENIFSTLAFLGRANVGKSTIFNALICKKLSIVSHRANTTRQQLQADMIIDECSSITCVDTPGINSKKGMAYEDLRLMQRAVSVGIESAQIILFISEAIKWTSEDQKILKFIFEHQKKYPEKKVFWVINKIDTMPDKSKFLKYIQNIVEQYGAFNEVFLVSAKRLEGLDQLRKTISDCWTFFNTTKNALTVNKLPYQNETLSFHIQEAVRQQIYTLCYAEIPYIVEISVDKEIDHLETQHIVWNVMLTVDRLSQKKILMGRQGLLFQKIKERSQERLKVLFGYEFNIHWLVTLKKQLNYSKKAIPIVQMLSSDTKYFSG